MTEFIIYSYNSINNYNYFPFGNNHYVRRTNTTEHLLSTILKIYCNWNKLGVDFRVTEESATCNSRKLTFYLLSFFISMTMVLLPSVSSEELNECFFGITTKSVASKIGFPPKKAPVSVTSTCCSMRFLDWHFMTTTGEKYFQLRWKKMNYVMKNIFSHTLTYCIWH